MNIPLEIYRKIILYGAIVPLHYTAYKTATIRPIFSNELNCNLTGTITLDEEDDLFDLFEGQLTGVDLEYYQYLLSQ
tara:strand:- start:20013 stop:20243 length:231 start_codon:yes stop_codon:yes gene_type:complete